MWSLIIPTSLFLTPLAPEDLSGTHYATLSPISTSLCHSLLVTDVHDSDSEDSINSPEAPQYSSISETADNHHDGETLTQNISQDDEVPQLETEPTISNLAI